METLLIGSGVVADLGNFYGKQSPRKKGLQVISRLLIDQKCQMVTSATVYSILLGKITALINWAWRAEGQRAGNQSAYGDETGQWQIYYQSFLEDKEAFSLALKQRCQRALDTIRWFAKFRNRIGMIFLKISQMQKLEQMRPRSRMVFSQVMNLILKDLWEMILLA